LSETSANPSPGGAPTGKATRTDNKTNRRQPSYSPPPTYTARPRIQSHRAKPGTQPEPVRRFDPQAALLRAQYQSQPRRNRMRLIVLVVIGIMVASGAGIYAIVSDYLWHVRDAWSVIFVKPPATRPDARGTPVVVTYPEWGEEPVNILLLGLDLREEERDTRADTQILVHVDPVSRSASLVSIPRDLFVPIPGFADDRINAAYQLGENNKADIPGGGASLAMATVEHNLGVPVHYFVQVDFAGFEAVIDALGGLTIDVPRPLVDSEYPFEDYGVTRLYVPAGLQHMDGRTALAYARSRHTDNDIARNSRQQQVLLAARQQGLNLNLLGKLTELADRLKDAVRTDLSLDQIGSLYKLAQGIDSDAVQSLAIDGSMVSDVRLPDGRQVLLPDWSVIRPLVALAFSDPLLVKEAARISVQNGTTLGGAGRQVYDELVPLGFDVVELGTRPAQERGTYPLTTITDYTNGRKPRTIRVLCDTLGLDCSQVRRSDPAGAPAAPADGLPIDIMIIAGEDRLE
jgi:LCP family protein required for cell wall assembly